MNMTSLKNKISIERGLALVTLILVGKLKKLIWNINTIVYIFYLPLGCFMISWLPYATVSFYRILFNDAEVSPLWGTLPALFAKSSLLWNTLLYLLINGQIKKKCLKLPQKIFSCRCRRRKQRESAECIFSSHLNY